MLKLNYHGLNETGDVRTLTFNTNEDRLAFIWDRLDNTSIVFTLIINDSAEYNDVLVFSRLTPNLHQGLFDCKKEMWLFEWESWRSAYKNAIDFRESTPLF